MSRRAVVAVVGGAKVPRKGKHFSETRALQFERAAGQTSSWGESSAGVMVQHISVTSWSHLKHIQAVAMPRDHASASPAFYFQKAKAVLRLC